MGYSGLQSGSVRVWGGISFEAQTDLLIIDNVSVTAQRYLENILQPRGMPFRTFIFARFQNSDRVFGYGWNSTFTMRFQLHAGIPDLNSIEYLTI